MKNMAIFLKTKQWFNNLSLQKKLFWVYLIAFVLPILFITLYSIRGMVLIYNEKSLAENQAQCNQIVENMEVKLNEFYKSVLNFSNSPIINNYFEYEYPDNSTFFNAYPKVSLHLTSFLVSNPQISRMIVYTDNPTFIKNNASILEYTDEMKDEFSALLAKYPEPAPTLVKTEETPKGVRINLYSPISFIKSPKYETMLFISYPEDILYTFYQHETRKLKLYLISPAGEIISSSDRTQPGQQEATVETISFIKQTELLQGKLTPVEKSYYYYSSFPDSSLLAGWNIYIEISNESYFEDVSSLITQSLFLIFLLFLLGLILYCLCSLSITGRLNRLINTMSTICDDETLDVILETDSKDEIGILAQNFEKMLKRIKKLIFDVYTSDLQVKDLEIKSKQAELLALQSQINPHFLFNTMQSLAINCYNNDDFETAVYINKFCMFLRDCLYWETRCVPLSEEIRVVENYLSLQKLRYQDSLDYRIDIPEEFYGVSIPKFTLQPIVENAIEHGLEEKNGDKTPGLIRIEATSRGDEIQIAVEDNGAGIPADRLQKINTLLKNQSEKQATKSIGIFNTNERLKLFYGPDFGIHMESTENTGTRVTISIAWMNTNIEP